MGQKLAVVVDESFFSQLPTLQEVGRDKAEIAWMVYGFEKKNGRYLLHRKGVHFTQFESALSTITSSEAGNVDDFLGYLRERISKGNIMGIPEPTGIPPDVEPPDYLLEK